MDCFKHWKATVMVCSGELFHRILDISPQPFQPPFFIPKSSLATDVAYSLVDSFTYPVYIVGLLWAGHQAGGSFHWWVKQTMELQPGGGYGEWTSHSSAWVGEGGLWERRMKIGELLREVREGFLEETSSSGMGRMARAWLGEQHMWSSQVRRTW